MLDTHFEGNPNGNEKHNQTGQLYGIMPSSSYPFDKFKVIINV